MKIQEHARMLSKGKSFECTKWQEFTKYTNDCFKQDFVFYNNALLICKKTHVSSVDNEPVLLYNDLQPIGCDSKYWEFVLSGNQGSSGASAYEIWLSLGNTGTEQDFIDSLKGEVGNIEWAEY